jgi:hypothetical protein
MWLKRAHLTVLSIEKYPKRAHLTALGIEKYPKRAHLTVLRCPPSLKQLIKLYKDIKTLDF